MLQQIIKPEKRFKYTIVIKLGLILSLSLLILAFQYFPSIEKSKFETEGPQELFIVEDIQQTVHEKPPPPPPPKPNVIIAKPSDEVLEDIEISSTEIDFSEKVAPPPPPPPKKKKIIVEEEPTYFVAVEEMPSPIGGVAGIQARIDYPEIAKRAGVEGTVFILAYLNEKGVVVKTEVVKGIGGGCDEAAAKAVKKTKFTPGKQRGKPVKVKVMVPIKFKLAAVSS